MSQSGPDVAGVRQGDVLDGKYRVERVLGMGGMGVVVAAHHIQLDEKVALKFLLPEALDHPESVARFAREARAAVKIKSEHVVRVSDVGTLPNGSPYMVMEYLEGGDLAAWVRQRGPLPIEQAIEFVLQACVAVADAHVLGIIHRDLKPANLFCIRRSDGQLTIKVLDFGISKMKGQAGLGGSGSVTRTSVMMGSPLYMSPEQMRSSKDVGPETDIWALGMILFELITGRPAFHAASVTELAIKVASDPTPTMRSLRSEVPPAVEAIVGKCLEKDRRRRYANVAELAVALLPFAPRAQASVERITGIIQGAGMAPSAFGMQTEAAAGFEGTQVVEGTLPPVGRTTTSGSRGHRTATIGVSILAGVTLLACVGSLIMLKHKANETTQAAAVQAASPPPVVPVVSAPVDAPKASVAPPVETEPPASASVPVVAPEPAVTPKKKAAGPAAPPPAPSKAAPLPAARCDPPYYFDANGNRMFKKECL